MNLAIIRKLPDSETGNIKVVVPSISKTTERVARPKQSFLGLVQPYKLGDVICVEDVEGQLYYSDRPYSAGDFTNPIPSGGYGFVTPFGYISFTESGIEIKHKNGGRLSISNGVLSTTNKDGITYVTQSAGSATSNFVKWR